MSGDFHNGLSPALDNGSQRNVDLSASRRCYGGMRMKCSVDGRWFIKKTFGLAGDLKCGNRCGVSFRVF